MSKKHIGSSFDDFLAEEGEWKACVARGLLFRLSPLAYRVHPELGGEIRSCPFGDVS